MDSRDRPADIRAPRRRPDGALRHLVLGSALIVVAVILVMPLLSGTAPGIPDPSAARPYEQPFRDAFASLLSWLRVLKWIAAGIFACVVAGALAWRRRGVANEASDDDATPQD